MMDFYIGTAVKTVVPHQIKIPGHNAAAVHGKIISLRHHTLHFHILTVPKRFTCIGHIHIAQHYPFCTPERFGRLNYGIFDGNILCIPYTRPRHIKHSGILHNHIFTVPQWIFPFKQGIVNLQITAFFQRRFSVCKSAIADMAILSLEHRPLPRQKLIHYFFHTYLRLFILVVTKTCQVTRLTSERRQGHCGKFHRS